MRATRVHVLIGSMILPVTPAIAQTAAPAANTSGGMGWDLDSAAARRGRRGSLVFHSPKQTHRDEFHGNGS